MSFIDKIRNYADEFSSEEENEQVGQIPIQRAIVQQKDTSSQNQNYFQTNDMFDIIKYHFRPKIIKERILLGGFLVVALTGTIYPVINPKQDDLSKTIEMVYGLTSGLLLTAGLYFRDKEERKYSAVDNATFELTKLALQSEFSYEKTKEDVISMHRIKLLLEGLSDEERKYWVSRYGLHGLVDEPIQEVAVIDSKPTKTIQNLPASQSSFAEMADRFGNQVDYSWLDEHAVFKSKAVIGETQSGKSFLLSYMASLFLSLAPNGELRIIDPHFDEDEDDSKWLPGIPVDYLMKHYLTKTQGLQAFEYAGNLLQERIEKGIKIKKRINGVETVNPECRPFHLVCDEFDAFLPGLKNEADREKVLLVIKQTQFEGRKYGVDITLGLHTTKQKVTGIDSSFLYPMNLFIFGSILADKNNGVPLDWDRLELLKSQAAMNSTLKQGRACIFRRLNCQPIAVAVPHIDLSIPIFNIEDEEGEARNKTDSSYTNSSESNLVETSQSVKYPSQAPAPGNGDWLVQMKSWLKSLENLPTPEQVRQKYQLIVMKEINDDQLKVLMNYLEILPEPEE